MIFEVHFESLHLQGYYLIAIFVATVTNHPVNYQGSLYVDFTGEVQVIEADFGFDSS